MAPALSERRHMSMRDVATVTASLAEAARAGGLGICFRLAQASGVPLRKRVPGCPKADRACEQLRSSASRGLHDA